VATLRRAPGTAAQRLGLLLPWLNDPTNLYAATPQAVSQWIRDGRRAVVQFLASFDGSSAAGHVELLRRSPSDLPLFIRRSVPHASALDPDSLQTLHVELRLVLDAALGGERAAMPLPTLSFGGRAARDEQKRSTLSRRARRDYRAPGAYVLQVAGSVHDVTMYLALHLLTAAGMAGAVGRCLAPAPAPRNPRLRRRGQDRPRCEKFFIRGGQGRPREFCSPACRVRRAEELKSQLEGRAR
jgi:hypothetical protein